MPAVPVHEAAAWRLADSVALRPEPFGALAYHFGTRKLSFLKTPDAGRRRTTPRRAARRSATRSRGAGVPSANWPAYLAAPSAPSPTAA